MADIASSRRSWNQKAKGNPYWYVLSFGPYEGRNLVDFWESGAKIWTDLKQRLGYQPKQSDVVVEMGYSVGRLIRAIVRAIHAFDLSENMLQKAKEFVPIGAGFHLADGCTLSDLDRLADIVLACCVLQHLPRESVLASHLVDIPEQECASL